MTPPERLLTAAFAILWASSFGVFLSFYLPRIRMGQAP
jgi:hypothetical protein